MRTASRARTRSCPDPPGGIVGAVEVSRLAGFDRIIGVRHGRHLDGRHALGRRVRARVRDRGCRRAAAGADDAHPHGRGGWRLDLHVRRLAIARGPAIGGREPGSGVLSARRTADGHRLQRDDRQARPAALSQGVRTRRRRAARCGDRARKIRALAADVVRQHRHRTHAPSRSPTASSTSPSRTWRTRSSTSRCSAATTSPATRCARSAEPAGQHACRVADALGMQRVFIHPLAGVLSAYGMGLADVRAMRQQAVEARLSQRVARRLQRRGSRRSKTVARQRRRWNKGSPRDAHPLRAHAACQVRRHRYDARRFRAPIRFRSSWPNSSAAIGSTTAF